MESKFSYNVYKGSPEIYRVCTYTEPTESLRNSLNCTVRKFRTVVNRVFVQTVSVGYYLVVITNPRQLVDYAVLNYLRVSSESPATANNRFCVKGRAE
jgi:hypothetical protein